MQLSNETIIASVIVCHLPTMGPPVWSNPQNRERAWGYHL